MSYANVEDRVYEITDISRFDNDLDGISVEFEELQRGLSNFTVEFFTLF